MAERVKIIDVFNKWFSTNGSRIEGRFKIDRHGDWENKNPAVLHLDLENDLVLGRVTAVSDTWEEPEWPFANIDYPLADAVALRIESEETAFSELRVKFEISLLDRWLAALESLSDSN